MNKLLRATLISLMLAGSTQAQTVALTALRSLALEYQPAVAVAGYPAQPVSGVVTFRSGEAFNVPSPGRVQQIEYLVEPGATVTKGQPFAVLRGPEMHHLQMNYASSQALATQAEQRYKRNRPLYERKAISESQWQEISEKYYATQLEYEHMRHFFELVRSASEDDDALTLAAPMNAVIDYRADNSRLEEGDSIALLLPREAIRVEVALPYRIGPDVSALRIGACELAIERVSARTDGLFVQAWTQSLLPACDLMLGQRVLALPLVRAENAFRIAKSAVFQLEQHTYIWIRSDDSLTAVPVILLGTEGESYVVGSDTPLAGTDVLTTSVSAVQGVLLGLGEE